MFPAMTAAASLRAPFSAVSGASARARGGLAPAVSVACLEACAPGRAELCNTQCGADSNCWAQCSGSAGAASCVSRCYQSAQ